VEKVIKMIKAIMIHTFWYEIDRSRGMRQGSRETANGSVAEKSGGNM